MSHFKNDEIMLRNSLKEAKVLSIKKANQNFLNEFCLNFLKG